MPPPIRCHERGNLLIGQGFFSGSAASSVFSLMLFVLDGLWSDLSGLINEIINAFRLSGT